MKKFLSLLALMLVTSIGAWAQFTPNAEKGYKLKLKGYDLYVNFAISGYTETHAVNATKLTNEANASVFAISSVAETENGFSLKWRNEYMKKSGTYGWNTTHGTGADTWYIVPVDGEDATYYIKKTTDESGAIFFGQKNEVSEGVYLYTDQREGNIKWELVECTYDAMMVNQGYWPETSTSAAPKYYSIRNTRNGNYYAQFVADNKNMALVSQEKFDANCYFYFIDVQEENLPYDVKAVKIANAATTNLCAGVNSYNAAGITWYIKKGVYNNSETVAIDKQTSFGQGWNNNGNNNTSIGQWSSNDINSTWEFKALKDQPHAIVPTMSTADNKVLYSIFNFRVNKFADSQEEGQQIKEVETRGLGSFWYFEDASAENSAELNAGVLPVYMVNALNGKYLKSHSTATNSGNAQYVDNKADAQIWYLTPFTKTNGTNNYIGYGIGKTTHTGNYVAWNDNGGNYVCQYSVNDAGSIWKFVPATNADVTVTINNAKTAWNKEVALYTFADYYSYDKKNVTAFGATVDAVSTSGNSVSNLQSAYPVLAARAAMLAGGKIGTPAAGDVIRLKNYSNSKYMNQAAEATTLSVVDAESDNNLWILDGDATNGFSLQNKASQKYLKGAGQSANFSLSDDPVYFDFNNAANCFATIREHGSTDGYAFAHYAAGTGKIVGWEAGADATRWSIACVENTETATLLATANEIIAKTGVGYPTAESAERSMLQSAITDGSAPLLREAIPAYYASTTVELPQVGKAYTIAFRKSDGTLKYIAEGGDNNFADFKSGAAIFVVGATADNTYNLLFVDNAGEYLRYHGASTHEYQQYGADFKCGAMVSATKAHMSDEYKTAEYLFGTVYLTANSRNSASAGSDGCLILEESNNLGNNSEEPFLNGTYTSALVIEEVTYPYNTANLQEVDGANYSTIYLPFAMTIPAGVKAYGVTGTTTDNVMVLNKVADGEEATDLPKGAYVLYSETVSGNTAILPAAANPAAVVDNLLVGSTAADATLPAGTKWVLGKKNGIGFYKYTGLQYPLGKAIYVDSSNQSNKLSFRFEDVLTAIEAVESNNTSAKIFDLQGRRLNKAQKGINIINGHKVLVK